MRKRARRTPISTLAQSLGPVGLLTFLTLTFATQAHALSDSSRERILRGDLNRLVPGTPFEKIFDRWEQSHGTKAAPLLLDLARTPRSLDEPRRYAALMGAARLGGRPIAPRLKVFLADPSWMLRSGALKAIEALNHAEVSPSTLSLINDKALVVRLQAVETIAKLRPSGATRALASAVSNQKNYHGGKALWVPQRALAALSSGVTDTPSEQEQDRIAAQKILESELKNPHDPRLRGLIRRAIQRIALR